MIKVIIFDFDGVIVDSVNVKTEAFAEMYSPYGKNVVRKVIEHHLAHGGVSRYEKFKIYHKDFLCVELTEAEVHKMAREFSGLVLNKVIAAPYVKGAYEFLSENYTNYDLYISSGTPDDELVSILKARGLINFFIDVFGSPEDKDKHVQKIINRNNYKKSDIVFIGDAAADLEAAKKNSISFIARIGNINSQLINEQYKIEDLSDIKLLINYI